MRSKILLVDDDPFNISILKEILESSYIVAVAENGADALKLLPEFLPDLILLDIMMPDMDGYEVCQKIRGDFKFSSTKIILVSGKSFVDARLEGYRAGADDYIIKPFIAEELEAKIKVFLRLKRAEEVDALKDDLLKLFGHETRTPLNGIIGIGGLLLDDARLERDQIEHIQMVVDCGYQLLEFTEKTRVLCTLKSGVSLDIQPIPLSHKINQVLEDFSLVLQTKKCAVELLFDDANEIIIGDWGYIDKALRYLLNNAIKFSNLNETIVNSYSMVDGWQILSVADTGIGVQDSQRSIIFDEFSIKDLIHHKKGQGLSLAIVKHIMAAHGGRVTVEKNHPKGAVFSLYFPYVQSNSMVDALSYLQQ